GVGGPEMSLEPALPVAVAQRRRAGGEQELARHEEVVRHRVRGQVGQIAEAEGAQRIGMSQVENLLAHVPGVTMSTHGRVLLGHRGVGGDVAVEEVVGECAQQVGYGTRQLVQVREDRLAQVDMRAGRPRVRSGGEQAYPDQAGRGRREELGPRQGFFRRLSVRRPHSRSEMPRRTLRMVDATSSTVASTSSWTTSNTASSSASRAATTDAAAITMAASARIAREIPVTTVTQVGIIAASPQ